MANMRAGNSRAIAGVGRRAILLVLGGAAAWPVAEQPEPR
jgi:hypothetical protein